MEFVITRKITLPFIRRARDPRIHIDDKVSSELHGIVKKAKSLYPTPTVLVTAKSGHFTIEKNDFFLFTFLYFID